MELEIRQHEATENQREDDQYAQGL